MNQVLRVQFHSFKKGITLLELVVVIAIVVLLTSVIVTSFSKFRNDKILDTGVENILSVLAKARGNTLSSKNAYQYGVHFEASRTILFRGTTYSSSDINNEIISLDDSLEISSISLTGGGVDVVFDRLTGKTSMDGSVILRLKSDTTKTKTITINGTGTASVN